MIKVPLLFMAASAALSYASVSEQNKQAKQLVDYQNKQKEAAYQKSMALNKVANEIKAVQERQALSLRYEAMRGASAAQGAERNTLQSRSQQQVMNALGYTAARESARISLEQRMADLGYEVNAQPQYGVAGGASPWLAGVQGGLSGLSMGMNLASSYNNLQTAQMMQTVQNTTEIPYLIQPDVYTGMGSNIYGADIPAWQGIPYR